MKKKRGATNTAKLATQIKRGIGNSAAMPNTHRLKSATLNPKKAKGPLEYRGTESFKHKSSSGYRKRKSQVLSF